MIRNIFFNELTFIVIDIIIGSLLAFFAILAYSKIKKISFLLFVLGALFLYFSMAARVLADLNIFYIKAILYNDIPILNFILNYIPSLFFITGFILLLKEK